MNVKIREIILGLLAPIFISVLVKLIRISIEIYGYRNIHKYLFISEIIIKTLIILGLYKFGKFNNISNRYLIIGLIGILIADLYILIK